MPPVYSREIADIKKNKPAKPRREQDNAEPDHDIEKISTPSGIIRPPNDSITVEPGEIEAKIDAIRSRANTGFSVDEKNRLSQATGNPEYEMNVKIIRDYYRYIKSVFLQMSILNSQLKAMRSAKSLAKEFIKRGGRTTGKAAVNTAAGMGGGAGGAALGTLIAPGVGTVIGGIAGVLAARYVANKGVDLAIDKTLEQLDWPKIAPAAYPNTSEIREIIGKAMKSQIVPGEDAFVTMAAKRKGMFAHAARILKEAGKLGLPVNTLLLTPYDTKKSVEGLSQDKVIKIANVINDIETIMIPRLNKAVEAWIKIDGGANTTVLKLLPVERISAAMELQWGDDVVISLDKICDKSGKAASVMNRNKALLDELSAHRAEPDSIDPSQMWHDLAKAVSTQRAADAK